MATTPNLGLNLPIHNSPDWDAPLNANFTSVDTIVGGGVADQVLTSNGPGTVPTYQPLPPPNPGTVTSVDITVPPEFVATGSPITSAGTIGISKNNQLANQVWAGPVSGSATAPLFRPLVAADVPFVLGLSTVDIRDFLSAGATADIQINAAIASISIGGTVDCRGYGGGVQTIAAPVLIGNSTKQICVIIDRATQFNITATGGVDVIQIWEESSLVALDMGNVQLVANFVVEDAAVINNVVASYPRTAGLASIVNIRGITIRGNITATVGGAMIDLIGVTDHTTIQDCIAYDFKGPGLRIRNGAGGVPVGPINITNCSFNGSGQTGAIPVRIEDVSGGGVMADINFVGGSMTHPGAGGLAMVDIHGTASNAINGVNFFGVQFESINAGDIGISVLNATGIHGSGLLFSSAGVPGTSCIKITQSGGGVSYNLTFDNVTNFNSWTNTIQDTINSVLITDPRVSRYTFLAPGANACIFYGSSGKVMAITQNSIGLAATNLGFYGTNPAPKPTITGAKGANAALTSLLTNLATLGLIVDATS